MCPGQTEAYIVDGVEKKLSGIQSVENVVKYEVSANQATEMVTAIEQRLAKRYHALAENTRIEDTNFILLVINCFDAVEAISGNGAAIAAYNNIVGKYKSMNVAVIVGNIENANISYSAPEIYKKIRESKQLFFFDDLEKMKLIDVSLSVIREHKKPISIGDCFVVIDGNVRRVKVPVLQSQGD